MLYRTAISDARSELGDTYVGSYSYAPADVIRYAAEGVRAAWIKRPSLRYDEATGLLYDPAVVLPKVETDDYLPIPLAEAAQPALAFFIVFRCLSRDVTDKGNAAAAAAAKAQFDQIVMG